MTPTETALLSPDQLFKMSAAQQNAYFASLKPDQAAAEKTKLNDYKKHVNNANVTYLQKSLDKYMLCPPSGGGTSANYAPNTALQFNLPSAGGAYVRELEVSIDIKVSLATGTTAVYAWTPAGAFAWFSDISITYGGNTQHHIRPYFLKVLSTIRRKQWLSNAQVLSGLNADATVTANVSQAQPTLTAGGTAVSKFKFRIPMQLHRFSPVGMLPVQGQGTKGQITFTCATAMGAANADPLATPINFVSGSGHSVTLDATEKTVTVFAIYNDGVNMESKNNLSLNMENLPTAQYIVDQQLNPVAAGSVQRQHISALMQHYIAISVVVDGVQSSSFSTAGNISSLELDMDTAGMNKFFYYGPSNNTTYYDYAERVRDIYGQDLDTGVILWANGLQFNTVDPDDNSGSQVLDMRSGHWPDVNYGVQLGSVSNANFAARIETYLFSLNDAGLVIAGQ